MNCCDHRCREGRDCPHSREALARLLSSRAALALLVVVIAAVAQRIG